MTIFQNLLLLVFPLAMVFAAISDLFTMKISNKLVLALIVAFAIAAWMAGIVWQDLGWHVLAGIVVLVVTFTFFAFGWVGGGDAKFAAASALWIGFPLLLPYVVYSAIFGGILTLAILLARRFPLPKRLQEVTWIDRLHNPKTGIPYGIALAIGGLILFTQSPLFVALATV